MVNPALAENMAKTDIIKDVYLIRISS